MVATIVGVFLGVIAVAVTGAFVGAILGVSGHIVGGVVRGVVGGAVVGGGIGAIAGGALGILGGAKDDEESMAIFLIYAIFPGAVIGLVSVVLEGIGVIDVFISPDDFGFLNSAGYMGAILFGPCVLVVACVLVLEIHQRILRAFPNLVERH